MALAAAATSQAQDLHGDVTVTADYLPTLRSHSRISPLPSAPRLSLPESSLNMASQGVPTLLQPSLTPMTAAGWNATKRFSRYPGYLELEGGSYADFNASAGYRFIDSEKLTVGAWLQHLSSTGFKPESNLPDVKACAEKRFDETLGLYGLYKINGLGTADFDLIYHLGYFNYYSEMYPDIDGSPKPPTQTLNDLTARVGLRSDKKYEGFSWHAELSDRFFGYRRFYSLLSPFSPAKENNLQLSGAAAYAFNPNAAVDLALTANYVGYSSAGVSDEPLAETYNPDLSGYGRVALTPAFNYSDGAFSARLGVRFDFTSPLAKQSQALVLSQKSFGRVHAAPDVILGYSKGKMALNLAVGGGVELRSLASGAELFYYQSPQLPTTMPLYSPLNASLTLNLGSFYGFSANVGLAYKITDNTTPDLLYPSLITGAFYPVENFYTLNVKGYSLRAGVSYRYVDIASFSADMSYQPQNGDKGFFNGADRPRWIIGIDAEVNPWSTLRINAGYQYRGVRNAWYYGNLPGITNPGIAGDIPEFFSSAVRLNDVTDLSLGASYTFMERYTVRLNASNLLGTNSLIAPGVSSEGVRILGGFAVLF